MPNHVAQLLIWLFDPSDLETKAMLAFFGIAIWFGLFILAAGLVARLVLGKE